MTPQDVRARFARCIAETSVAFVARCTELDPTAVEAVAGSLPLPPALASIARGGVRHLWSEASR